MADFKRFRYFLTFLAMLLVEAFALEFYVDSGRESGRDFAVLNLRDEKPFECYEEFNRNSEVSAVVCSFKAPLLSRFQRSETLFFSIVPDVLRDAAEGFSIRIIPKAGKKMKLYNTEFDLVSNQRIPVENNSQSKRWQILGYEGEIPFLNDKPSYGINFPMSFNEVPSIGVLDAQMRPMDDQVGRDKDYFLNVQSFVERHSYAEALSTIDEMLGIYPETIFKRDVLYLRLVALDGMRNAENYEEIIALGKAWLGAYPTDIHVPQVLFIMAKTYAGMKFFEEAKYYYDRLFNEYKGDKYELLARLDYGDHLYARGDRRVVLEMYESVLNEAKDLEVASLASVLLGDYYRKGGEKKRAEKHLSDTLQANPNFFLQDIPKYYTMMQSWAEFGIYETPAKVLEVMFNTFEDKAVPLYLPMLKDMAMWFDKAGDLQKAHAYYQLFLKESDSEAERKEVKALDDALLLNDKESDAAKRLEHYDYVIANYKGKEEEGIALEKKAQTYYDLGDYLRVFAMREELNSVLGEDMPVLINAVSMLIREALAAEDCKEAAYYGSLYGIKLALQDDEFLKLFDCLYANRQFIPALEIAKEKSMQATTPKQKEEWLYRLAWVEYSSQNYPKASLAARDTLNLLSDPKHNDSAWVLFMSQIKQGNQEEAFKLLPRLEESLKNSNKMIEVYRVMLQDALVRKDDTAIQLYAKSLMDLQEMHGRYEYSPWVELGVVEALNREGRFRESLDLLKRAELYANKETEKIQIYYLEGYLYDKLGDKNMAVESYGKCEALNAESPWKNLCIDAKKLLENVQ
ncbi:tetratricopeptide repeat protein [Helicobacter sp.]|uniref:tetratricopeptide repeat protein n=1 Tax=Helicobacter sp. TaxID=218 RepID=UPI0025C57FD8|nr:flagellar functional protein [Helicobacter sp.]MCI5967999.1 flagellar functional protein [Helicobacter sp.]MDY2584650.1 flagellar functional protein [Helicobacter sp.]